MPLEVLHTSHHEAGPATAPYDRELWLVPLRRDQGELREVMSGAQANASRIIVLDVALVSSVTSLRVRVPLLIRARRNWGQCSAYTIHEVDWRRWVVQEVDRHPLNALRVVRDCHCGDGPRILVAAELAFAMIVLIARGAIVTDFLTTMSCSNPGRGAK